MSKKIEEVFDLPPMHNEVNASFPSDQEEQTTGLDLEKMQQHKMMTSVAILAQAV